MKDQASQPPQTALRPPSVVMRLSRLGAAFPTRLSFLRVLTRRLSREGARLARPVWQIDARGYGHAVYTIALGGYDYSLVAVSTHLPDEMRTDRVIATAWDTAYVLYDGVPDKAEISRICATAPKQEAARFTERDLVLSRANKSVRLFSHVVDCLRAGRQPDAAVINRVGYLMRTTAVYGNGKFGIADRAVIAGRSGINGAFAAEMLTVWMIRNFTHDLVEHIGGATLAPRLKRQLGIGNSTGLGMAPFLVSHPVLLNNWILAKETALARVRALPTIPPAKRMLLNNLASRAAAHLAEWQVPDPHHQARIDLLRTEWPIVQRALTNLPNERPINELICRSEELSPDTQELCVALAIEAFGETIDDLVENMTDLRGPPVPNVASAQDLRKLIKDHFEWALDIDFGDIGQNRLFWYVSAEKQEPRIGDRFAEPGAERESPLDIARRVQALYRDLEGVHDLHAFRATQPQHDLALMRVACTAQHPYAEIRDNLIAETCLPVDMLRCKLAFFGATKFDPKSDRWTRITLAQGAPLPVDLGTERADDWWLAGMEG